MKRILKAISILLLAFLVGCSGTKEETKVYTKQQKGVTMELTFYYKGDKVVKQTSKNTIVYADLGLTKEQVKKQLDPVAKKYQGIEGLEDKLDFQETQVVENLTIDYTKAKLSQLKGMPGITIEAEDGQDVSMKKSEELLKQQGFTEKK